jgi:hypothetical protein
MKRKVKKLALELFATMQKQFPEIQFLGIQEHPEQYDRFWINVAGQMNEDREIELNQYSGTVATQILIDEGYSFGILVRNSIETA